MAKTIRRAGFRSVLIRRDHRDQRLYIGYGCSPRKRPSGDLRHLMLGGLVNSMVMVAMTTLSFSDIPKARMSHATTLSTMAQQVSLRRRGCAGALMVERAAWWNDGKCEPDRGGGLMPAS